MVSNITCTCGAEGMLLSGMLMLNCLQCGREETLQQGRQRGHARVIASPEAGPKFAHLSGQDLRALLLEPLPSWSAESGW